MALVGSAIMEMTILPSQAMTRNSSSSVSS
jgi:hypothetical protein